MKKVIGFLGDHLMVRDPDGQYDNEHEVFVDDENVLVAYSKDDPQHPEAGEREQNKATDDKEG